MRGLSKQYHIIFYTKLGYSTCEIRLIPCVCYEFTSMLYKPWLTDLKTQQQLRCHHLTDWTYLPVIDSFNSCNIIILSHKSTTSEVFEDICQVFIYGISKNMALLVQYGKYSSMNTTYSTTMGYYVINCFSEA